jgi:transcriptional regulator with XRE-family HTH domain
MASANFTDKSRSGLRLHQHRVKRRITAEELAKRSGLTAEQIIKMEQRSGAVAQIDKLIKLAQQIGIERGQLHREDYDTQEAWIAALRSRTT